MNRPKISAFADLCNEQLYQENYFKRGISGSNADRASDKSICLRGSNAVYPRSDDVGVSEDDMRDRIPLFSDTLNHCWSYNVHYVLSLQRFWNAGQVYSLVADSFFHIDD